MIDLSNYNIYENKDGRLRAYNKTTHKVTSYPRVLMEAILGRPLLPTEDVHHKDKNPLNNNPSNLEVMDHREHDRMHGSGNKKYFDKEMTCPICGNLFIWTPRQQSRFYKTSIERSGGPFCSKHCAGTHNQRVQAEKGLATKYSDKIAICAGCEKPFIYTAKSQRDHKKKTRNRPYCSIECYRKSTTKYTEEKLKEIQECLYKNNGHFAQTERELGLPAGHMRDILQHHGLPFHKKDYIKFSA